MPPKRRFLQEPHDVTSQKTPFFKQIFALNGEGKYVHQAGKMSELVPRKLFHSFQSH
jgi:hypothetical protein